MARWIIQRVGAGFMITENGEFKTAVALFQEKTLLMNPHITWVVAATICLSVGTALGAVADKGVANVQDFGAKGDGHSDDTAAILKALASVPERGGVVYFPPGQYRSATIPGRSGVTFKGDSGWGYHGDAFGASTISPARDDLSCLFDLKGAVGTRLVGLVLDGKGKGKEINGVYSKHPGTEQNIVIDDCKITGFTGSGVRLDNSWVFAIRHSYIVHNKLSGIDGSGSYDGWILDNQITGNQRGGIYGTTFATVTITANRIEWNRLGGIVLGPAGANTIQIGNCTFDRNFGPGIDLNLTDARQCDPWKPLSPQWLPARGRAGGQHSPPSAQRERDCGYRQLVPGCAPPQRRQRRPDPFTHQRHGARRLGRVGGGQ